jgi:hypothetical protein
LANRLSVDHADADTNRSAAVNPPPPSHSAAAQSRTHGHHRQRDSLIVAGVLRGILRRGTHSAEAEVEQPQGCTPNRPSSLPA